MDQDLPPLTQYGDLASLETDSRSNLPVIDWDQVFAFEPEKVSAWAWYLHRHGHVNQLQALLTAFETISSTRGAAYDRPERWTELENTRFPSAVGNIFCEAWSTLRSDDAGLLTVSSIALLATCLSIDDADHDAFLQLRQFDRNSRTKCGLRTYFVDAFGLCLMQVQRT